MRPSLSPPMSMHLLGDGDEDEEVDEEDAGDDSWMDSKATKLGKLLYWNRLPLNVP